MNKIISLAAVAILLSISSCTTTQKQQSYKTLASIGLAVQKSMQSAAVARKNGKINDEKWLQLVELHDNRFLPAYNTACDIAGHDYTQSVPADLAAIATSLINLITQLTQ